jgi:hypothetical protein
MSKKNQKLKNYLCYLSKENIIPNSDAVVTLIYEYTRQCGEGLFKPVNAGGAVARTACVGIVGGGIGGFALAVALQSRGIKSIVFEKDSSFEERQQGTCTFS